MKIGVLRTAGLALILLGLLLLSYGIYLAFTPNVYQSTVRIKVEKDMQEISGLSDSSLPYDPYWIQTEFEKIQSKLILYPVITNLNLNKSWAENKKHDHDLPIEETYTLLKAHTFVRQARSTTLFEIMVRIEDSKEAADIANAIAEVYRQHRIAMKRDLVLRGIKTYTNELRKQNQKIAALEAQVSQPSTELTSTTKAQQELVMMKEAKECLQKRIEQETASNDVKSTVEIIDRAEPALKPIYPNKIKMRAAIFLGALSVIMGMVLLKRGTATIT